jgi:hypothetical protein
LFKRFGEKMLANPKTIRIGNSSGYWGDDPDALRRQVKNSDLDYVTMDFLAEVTMSILHKQKEKNPNLGYAVDLVPIFKQALPYLIEKKTTLITNAGGMNPVACARALLKVAKESHYSLRVAVVANDSIMSKVTKLYTNDKAKFTNLEDQREFSLISDKITSANVYFGANPIAQALKNWQPDVVLTGRVSDAALILGPLIHEFSWGLRDWDLLASGMVAGHLLECGSQVSGGNFSDWEKVESFSQIGYPFADVSADGSFVLSKTPNSGGLVSVDTVREQLFYEINDPRAYLTPDVVVDFSHLSLQLVAKDQVLVKGAKGYPPTDSYKVSLSFADGYKACGQILVSGPQAFEKAKKFSDIFWERISQDFAEKNTDYVGLSGCCGEVGAKYQANEILLRLSVKDQNREKVRQFTKMVSSLLLSGPPGVAVVEGTPKVRKVISYWPTLLKKKYVAPVLSCSDDDFSKEIFCDPAVAGEFVNKSSDPQVASEATKTLEQVFGTKGGQDLLSICIARRGDKGNLVNIGVFARSQESFDFLKENLSAQVIKNFFQKMCKGRVLRYCADNIWGFNFVLEQSLGGGGTCTLRLDAQGKTYAQVLLQQKFVIPDSVLKSIK